MKKFIPKREEKKEKKKIPFLFSKKGVTIYAVTQEEAIKIFNKKYSLK